MSRLSRFTSTPDAKFVCAPGESHETISDDEKLFPKYFAYRDTGYVNGKTSVEGGRITIYMTLTVISTPF